MAKVEYRVCSVAGGAAAEIEAQLNAVLRALATEDWRFVETIYAAKNQPLLLFKRPVKQKQVGLPPTPSH